ncbi:hypothetical protein D3C75_1023790 [compost metagenome]
MIIEQTQQLINVGEDKLRTCNDPDMKTLLAIMIEALRQVQMTASRRKLTGCEFLRYRDVLLEAKQLHLVVDEATAIAKQEEQCL